MRLRSKPVLCARGLWSSYAYEEESKCLWMWPNHRIAIEMSKALERSSLYFFKEVIVIDLSEMGLFGSFGIMLMILAWLSVILALKTEKIYVLRLSISSLCSCLHHLLFL